MWRKNLQNWYIYWTIPRTLYWYRWIVTSKTFINWLTHCSYMSVNIVYGYLLIWRYTKDLIFVHITVISVNIIYGYLLIWRYRNTGSGIFHVIFLFLYHEHTYVLIFLLYFVYAFRIDYISNIEPPNREKNVSVKRYKMYTFLY